MSRKLRRPSAAYWPILVAGLGLSASSALAQEDMPGMNMPDMQMPDMQMPDMQMPAKKSRPKRLGEERAAPAGSSPAAQTTPMQQLRFGNMIGERPRPEGLARSARRMPTPSMGNMDTSSMQGGAAPRDARNPDYSDGYGYRAMPGMAMSDHSRQAMLLLDQFEYARGNHGGAGAFLDGEFRYGADFNRLWLKSEGNYANGRLEDLRTEALWSHAVKSYWDTQVGLRQDLGEGPGRTWAALGIQGLAPYWLDTEATLYFGESSRTAARLTLEYEGFLTQRWVLQPKLEVNLYGKDDPRRGIGSGLSDTEIALRLRYEPEREFGPYLGLVWRQRHGRTADLARAQQRPSGDLQVVAGLHAWY